MAVCIALAVAVAVALAVVLVPFGLFYSYVKKRPVTHLLNVLGVHTGSKDFIINH